MQVSKSDLIHHRLQAMLREHSFSDLKYLGVRPDSIGMDQHWYMIGDNEVPVDAIEELESEETDDESDTIRNLPNISFNQKSFFQFKV